jgi:CubicO group peptidase (beta-lactamase class C family)
MKTQVFEPLGMNDTLAESAKQPVPGRATFYFPRFGGDPRYGLHDMRELDLSCYAGAMVFLSTPSDLVRFGLAINGGKLLKPAIVEAFQTPQRLAKGESSGYGLGWDVEPVTLWGAQARAVGHDGRILGGTVASLWTFPERGLVVAITSNISYAETFALASKIAEAFVQRGERSIR